MVSSRAGCLLTWRSLFDSQAWSPVEQVVSWPEEVYSTAKHGRQSSSCLLTWRSLFDRQAWSPVEKQCSRASVSSCPEEVSLSVSCRTFFADYYREYCCRPYMNNSWFIIARLPCKIMTCQIKTTNLFPIISEHNFKLTEWLTAHSICLQLYNVHKQILYLGTYTVVVHCG